MVELVLTAIVVQEAAPTTLYCTSYVAPVTTPQLSAAEFDVMEEAASPVGTVAVHVEPFVMLKLALEMS